MKVRKRCRKKRGSGVGGIGRQEADTGREWGDGREGRWRLEKRICDASIRVGCGPFCTCSVRLVPDGLFVLVGQCNSTHFLIENEGAYE